MTNACKINQCIREICKPINLFGSDFEKVLNEDSIVFDEYSQEYFEDLFMNFEILLNNQINEKCDNILLNMYLDECIIELEKNRQNGEQFSARYRRYQENFNNANANSYTGIMLNTSSTLEDIKELLLEEIEKNDFNNYTTRDSNTTTQSNQNYENNNANNLAIPTTPIPSNKNFEHKSVGKMTFNLSKKESLMLLYILEENKLLKFENNTQRKNFIEKNFNYTEQRASQFYGEAFPMKGTKSEYSLLKSDNKDDIKSNNNTLNDLSKELISIFSNFEFVKKVK